MNDKILMNKQRALKILCELHWLDVSLFKLGTKLGAEGSSREEIAEELLKFFIENEVGNRISKIKNILRVDLEKGFRDSSLEVDLVNKAMEKYIRKALKNNNFG